MKLPSLGKMGRTGLLGRGVSAVAFAALLSTAGAWWGLHQLAFERSARDAFPIESGRVPVAGLAAAVEVLRDGRGIPHIEALRERDAWLALGFVHAQDRLAQMLWLRRLARGRTAEWIGESGLRADRMARTLGIGYYADAQAERIDARLRSLLEAYAEGVNTWLARIRAGTAPAPLLLRDRVGELEDWRAADCIAVDKLVSWASGNGLEAGLVLDGLIERLGGALARPFRPTGGGVRGVAGVPDPLPEGLPEPGAVPDAPLREERAPATDVGIRGGNAWVLAGGITASGAPILVADLQLSPTVPALLYEAHVRGGSLDAAGATIPGIPVIWAGRNLHVAWAATPARAVIADYYREIVRREQGLYQNGSLWVPLDERRERIRVRTESGELREEPLVVRSTRHGPLVNALIDPARSPRRGLRAADGSAPGDDEDDERPALALAWTGALPGDGIGSMLAVARSSDAGELLEALRAHHEPAIAVAYADRRGAGGVQLAGWLPRRALPTDMVPVPGRMRLYDWREAIDFSELPAQRLGPRNTWVVASDGQLGDGLSASGIEWSWRAGEQDRRLRERLRELTADEAPAIDLRRAAELQNDVGSGVAREVVPALLRLVRLGGRLTPAAREVANLLGRWDGRVEQRSSGAAAYHVLMEHMIGELFLGPLGADLTRRYLMLPGVRPQAVVARVILAADAEGSAGGWSDGSRVAEAVRRGLHASWISLSHRLGPSRERWQWGRLHRLVFRPFGLAGLGRRATAALPALALAGDATTLAASSARHVGSFEIETAGIYRLAVDLAAPDRMLSALAPGQSEHPLHPHYADGLQRWSSGRPELFLMSRLLVEEESGERLLLEPES